MNNRNRSGGYSSSSSSSSRGRGRQSWRNVTSDSSPLSQTPVRADASSVRRMSAGSLDRKSHKEWQVKGHNSDGAVPRNSRNVTPAVCHSQQQGSPLFRDESSLDKEPRCSRKLEGHSSDGVVSQNNANVASSGHQDQQQDCSSSSTVEEKVPIMQNADHLTDVSRLSLESVVDSSVSRSGDETLESNGNTRDHKDSEQHSTPVEVFDICPPKSSDVVTLKPPLFAKNREKRNEMKNSIDRPKGTILRPGMVLLKSYLSSSEQADILRICRTHGLGSAGFYQPQYREGGKLHLKMMCFGEFWDPETSTYGELRPMDNAKPSPVPAEFRLLVDKAMKFCHSLIAERSKVKNAEDILPSVNPDICLVNYYAKTGRLGLHQDKDESRETLNRGIPIVSFSIGDSAEFLYGDQSNVDQAEKVILESGDVLIFGGESRHIFHGVSAILPDTAPKSLLEGTNFRPGRLNLTFRQRR